MDATPSAEILRDSAGFALKSTQFFAGSKDFAHERQTKAPEGTTTGVAAGGTIGGTLGLLAGIGALVGALVGMGIPEYEAL